MQWVSAVEDYKDDVGTAMHVPRIQCNVLYMTCRLKAMEARDAHLTIDLKFRG